MTDVDILFPQQLKHYSKTVTLLAHVYVIENEVCPSVDPNSGGACVIECTDDSNCTNQLCCSNGCDRVCTDPLNCTVSIYRRSGKFHH